MKAIRFLGERQLEVTHVPDPTPGSGEVVIEIKASGMCGSDLRTYRPPAGDRQLIIAGHEPCGVIAAVGPGVRPSQAKVGQRVMDHHYAGCGACIHCRGGWTQMCEEGSIVYGSYGGDGGHAQYMLAPAYTVVPMPEGMTFSAGAAVSCGTGTAYGGLRRLDVSGRDTVAIFGQGPVGLSGTILARAMGARVIAVDLVPARREAALALGADVVLDPAEVDVVEMVRELTRGRGVDCALECTSSPDARAAAVRGTRPFGRVCFVGMGGDLNVDVTNDIIKKQLTLMGSWTFTASGQAECAQFVMDREVDVDALFTDRWTLDDAEQAYRLFDGGESGKGVFLP
jgi:threonine dehydrogenase-like Zn-dependent dehydrogenase